MNYNFKKNYIELLYLYHSKPLNYAIALNELGSETVHKYVGQEPSGRKFNELDLDYNSKLALKHKSTQNGLSSSVNSCCSGFI